MLLPDKQATNLLLKLMATTALSGQETPVVALLCKELKKGWSVNQGTHHRPRAQTF